MSRRASKEPETAPVVVDQRFKAKHSERKMAVGVFTSQAVQRTKDLLPRSR